MPRTATLKPKEIKGRKSPWLLSVPPSLSSTGDRQRLFFRTRGEAESELRVIQNRHISGQVGLLPADASDAAAAIQLLEPTGVRLLDAVREFVSMHNRRKQSKTLGEVFEAYMGKQPVPSKDYLDSVRHLRANLDHLLDRSVVDITAADLEDALKDLRRTGTRNLRIGRLRTVLGFAVHKGWLQVSPAASLDMSDIRKDEVRIYHADEVERMLRSALTYDPELIPFLSIAAFCGLRPERETFHLDWSDVHLEDGEPQIVVTPKLSKTRRRRFVDIPENCIGWIKASGVPMEGRVCQFSDSTLKRKRQENRQQAGVGVIPDGLRHSYCSAYLAKHKDVNKLLLQRGHTSTAMLFRHYHRAMTASEAERYWNIVPTA